MKRLLAVLIALVLAVSLIAAAGGMRSGHRTDGLYYAAADIHPDAQLLKVNDDAISAEEYLYWLAYDCEYLTSYSPDLDWDAEVSDGMTYAQYAKHDAVEAVKLYTIVRQWARQANITLSDDDRAALEAQRQEYVTYYGGEEAYARQIQLLGVSAETFESINSVFYLFNQVQQQFCTPGSSLYPGDAALQSFADEQQYLTVKLLYLSTVSLENQTLIDAKKTTAENYAQQLVKADDVDAVYAELAAELGLEGQYPENGLTLSANDTSLDAELLSAIQALSEGEVSDVISCDNGFYVAVRMPLDREAVAAEYFNLQLQQARDSAKVEYNDKLYDPIDVAAFYSALQQQRKELQEQFDAAGAPVPDENSTLGSNLENSTVLPGR